MLLIALALIALVDLGTTYTVNDCPATLTRDQYLKVFEDSCFQFVLYRSREFPKAQQECQADQGTLALVKTPEINEFIKNQLAALQYRGDYVWIGLHDEKEEGTFVWVDGTPSNYTNWVDGVQPHDVFEYRWTDCVAVNPVNGEWHDEHCENGLNGLIDHSRPFVCQYNLSGPQPTPTV